MSGYKLLMSGSTRDYMRTAVAFLNDALNQKRAIDRAKRKH